MENVNEDNENDNGFLTFEDEDNENIKLSRKQKAKCDKYTKKYVAAGFREDAENILREFLSENSLGFSSFGKLWQKNHYNLLYMGKENERELYEATYEMFRITLNFISDPKCDYTTKVGAIYLLYCLFEKQPFPKLKVKIRILSHNLKDMLLIFNAAKEAGIDDCVYIIAKLLYSGAFHIVHCHFLMGPESSESRNSPNDGNTISVRPWNTEIKKLWDSGLGQKTKDIQEEINKLAQEIGISSLISDDNSTVDFFLKFGELAAKGDESVFDMLEDNDKKAPKPHIDMSIGMRRSKLKERQLYAECTASTSRYLSRKHVENEDVDVDNPDLLESDSEFSSYEKSDKPETSIGNFEKCFEELRSGNASNSKQTTKKKSCSKARAVGKSRPEKKIAKGKKMKYYEDSDDEDA